MLLLALALLLALGACSTETTCTGYPGIDRASCTTTNSGGEWLGDNWQLILGGLFLVGALINWATQQSNKKSTHAGAAQSQPPQLPGGTQVIRASDVRLGDLLLGNSSHAGGRVSHLSLLAGGAVQITYDHGRTYVFNPNDQLMRRP